MSDYIDREAVMRQFADHVRRSNNSDFASTPTWNQAVQIVEDFPAADVKKVKHGKWVNGRACSMCGFDWFDWFYEWEIRFNRTNYCPDCGAKMDEK